MWLLYCLDYMPWVEFIVYFTFARMPGATYIISSLLLCSCEMSFERKWTPFLCCDYCVCEVVLYYWRQNYRYGNTRRLSRQRYACREKHNFVATKGLSRQGYFCRDKRRVLSPFLFCFVATKMIVVAAPASDSSAYPYVSVRIVMSWLRAVDGTLKLKRPSNSVNSRISGAAVACPLRNCRQGCTTEWRGGRMGWRGGLLQDSDQSDLTSGRISTSACWNHPRPFQSHLWVRTPIPPFCMCSHW